jgi:hypothetical protein
MNPEVVALQSWRSYPREIDVVGGKSLVRAAGVNEVQRASNQVKKLNSSDFEPQQLEDRQTPVAHQCGDCPGSQGPF